MVLRRRASRARAPLLPWVPETFLARLPCNAKRRQQEGWQKINTSNQQKQNDFAAWSTLFCTFLCHCFTRLQRDTSSYMFYGGNVLCVNACVFFFTAAYFVTSSSSSSTSFSIVIIASNVSCLVLFFINNCDFLLR